MPITSAEKIPMRDADVTLYREFFTPHESRAFFQRLYVDTSWEQPTIQLWGRIIPIPRLTAWHGDRAHTYSGITMDPYPWTATLLDIKHRVEEVASIQFNSVLLNCYRNGQDSVSWHADDESDLGENPVIASVSFGATRTFRFKHKRDRQQRASIELTDGSLLLMAGPTQHLWLHCLPKTQKPSEPRINLTFRIIR